MERGNKKAHFISNVSNALKYLENRKVIQQIHVARNNVSILFSDQTSQHSSTGYCRWQTYDYSRLDLDVDSLLSGEGERDRAGLRHFSSVWFEDRRFQHVRRRLQRQPWQSKRGSAGMGAQEDNRVRCFLRDTFLPVIVFGEFH